MDLWFVLDLSRRQRYVSLMQTEDHPNDGAGIRVIRETAGLTLRELAAAVSAQGQKVSHQHLARVETGERILTDALRLRLMRAVLDHGKTP